MNGADPLAVTRQREERYRCLSQSEFHLNQILAHLRYVHYYNRIANLQIELPDERVIIDAMSQCARLHQLDKEKTR